MTNKYLAILLFILLILPLGCAKKTEPVKAYYYPACHEPLAYLHSRGSGSGKAIAGSALQGGVISGIATAIVGAITGNLRPVGILAGVAAGGAVGGIAGGVSQYSAQAKQDNQQMAKYMEEIDGDISNMDIVSAAATASKQCYTRAFKSLTEEMRSGRITDASSDQRFTEISAGIKEADQLLGIKPDFAAMDSEYAAAARKQ